MIGCLSVHAQDVVKRYERGEFRVAPLATEEQKESEKQAREVVPDDDDPDAPARCGFLRNPKHG